MRLADHLVHQVGFPGTQIVVEGNLGSVGGIVGSLGIHTVVVYLDRDLVIENITYCASVDKLL